MLAGAGLAGLTAAGAFLSRRSRSSPGDFPPIRWGFVGTGNIASYMGSVVAGTPSAELVAVSSRRMETASSLMLTVIFWTDRTGFWLVSAQANPSGQ